MEEEKEIQKGEIERIERDGKTYLEFDMIQQLKYQKKKDIVMLILIAACVIALVMAITVIVKNADIINKDALIIGMENHGFVSCQCQDENNVEWYSRETGFATQPTSRPGLNYSNIINDLDTEE